MSKHAERIPVEDTYLRALGRATYNFAYLEWGIVWLTETMKAGFLNEVSELTAGKIANEFRDVVTALADNDQDKVELQQLASSFKNLVRDRNRLMHGNPFTAEKGEQRLLYNGEHGRKDWTVADINAFSEETAIASIEVGRLLHGGRLEHYYASKP